MTLHIEVPDMVGPTVDDILAKLIAWELVGRSVEGLHETSAEYANLARDLNDAGDERAWPQRRFALAVEYAANSIAGAQEDNEHNGQPLPHESPRGNLLRVLEYASEGLRIAEETLREEQTKHA